MNSQKRTPHRVRNRRGGRYFRFFWKENMTGRYFFAKPEGGQNLKGDLGIKRELRS